MSSQPLSENQFLDAKSEFLQRAMEAKATQGIIDNGHEMEDELVSRAHYIHFISN